MIPTVEEAKQHLNIELEFTDDDGLLAIFIDAAVSEVESYLGFSRLDFSANNVPDSVIKVAVNSIVGDMYRDREATTTSRRYNKLIGLRSLLDRYADLKSATS